MMIGFIGAGKVCHALSLYFGKRHSVGVFSKTSAHADHLAKKLKIRAYADMFSLVAASDLVFLSVPDDQIFIMAERIALSEADLTGKAFAHLSGSLSSEVLSLLHLKGAVTFSLHPAQSFSNPDLAILQLPNTVFTTEGTDGYERGVSALFEALPNEIFHIDSAHKVTYHVAMVLLSNYLITLYGLSEELLTSIGMTKRESSAILLPLLDSTVSNIREKGFQALTGPLSRGDRETIRNHLHELADCPSLSLLYRTLGTETIRMMCKYGSWNVDGNEMEKIMKSREEREYEKSDGENVSKVQGNGKENHDDDRV